MRRRLSSMAMDAALAVALAGAGAHALAADAYPNRPIRMIVPFAAGGNADIQGRFLAEKMSEALGKQVVVDNRFGAASIIGSELAARAPADGYTLLLVASNHAMNPSLVKKLPYDTLKDFASVSLVGSTPMLLTAHPSVPAANVKQLVALAKSRPGQLNYASSGNGSSANLAGALFNLLTRVNIVHVPYKGTNPASVDVMAGNVQIGYPSVTSAMPHVKSGKLKALAITTAKRSPLAPEIPTVAESGVPGYDASIWNALLAPAKTPPAILAQLNAAVVKIQSSAEARERYAALGADVMHSTPAELDAFIRAEMAKWARVIKESGIRVDLT